MAIEPMKAFRARSPTAISAFIFTNATFVAKDRRNKKTQKPLFQKSFFMVLLEHATYNLY